MSPVVDSGWEARLKAILDEPALEPTPRSLESTKSIGARAERLVPTLSQTFSKAPFQFVQGVAPLFADRGKGYRVWDVDHNAYIDWTMALCAVTLGYADDDVNAAVRRRLDEGTIFTLSHPLETELSEKLVELIPCGEMVRFGKNGSDATSGAVRLARAVTRRDFIACSGYHGWQDWYIGTTTRAQGVPAAVRTLTEAFRYNDIDGLHRIFREHPGEVAAVIMEPVGVVAPDEGFLEEVRELCHAEGALLVFDEVITGFRMALGGAQQHFGVTPDLACFGKGMANGFPISSVVGPERLMHAFDDVFFSFTFGGDTVALAASMATIDKMKREQVIAHFWRQGETLRDGVDYLIHAMQMQDTVDIAGYAPRTVMGFHEGSGQASLLYKSLFQQECIKRGLLFTGAHNLSYCHDDEAVAETFRVYRAALEVLKDAVERDAVEELLEGPPVQPVFRQP